MQVLSGSFLIVFVTFGILNLIEAQTKKTLKVTAVTDPPYLFKDKDGTFAGLVPDILEKLGYPYTIYFPPDNQYGSQFPNGIWSGMIGELVEQNADLAAVLTVTGKREEVVDFSYPIMSVGHSILLKKPHKLHHKPRSRSLMDNLRRLFEPLSPAVWLLTVLTILVTGTVLCIIMYFNPYEWRRLARDHEATAREGESFTCLNSFLFVISTLMWQGYTHAPRSIGARILVVAWWAFTIIFIVTYTASLTNYLSGGPWRRSATVEYTKVKSLRDLAENDEIRVGMLPGGATNAFFRNSKSAVYRQIYEKVTDDPLYGQLDSVADLVNHLRAQERYANFSVILESMTARYISGRKYCDLYVVHTGSAVRHMAFALQKNSTLTGEISRALIRLGDSGELQELELKWFKSQCKSSEIQEPDEGYIVYHGTLVDLGTFSIAFFIVLVGIVLGSIVCGIEICIFKLAENRSGKYNSEPVTIRTGNEDELEGSEHLMTPEETIGSTTV